MPKKLLFLTWDSGSSNYLETLFFPILAGLQAHGEVVPYVFQLSWAENQEVARLESLAASLGIGYFHQTIARRPHPALGSVIAVIQAVARLKSLVRNLEIDVLMPRSTMPAWVVLKLLPKLEFSPQVVFDADGFPIQERVDFAGLKERGWMHSLLTGIEDRMLKRADRVLTRSDKAVELHLQKNRGLCASKFYKVGNGRDGRQFYPGDAKADTRQRIGVRNDELLLVHSGSLGGSYESSLMFGLLRGLEDLDIPARLLLLTRDTATAKALIPSGLEGLVSVVSGSFEAVPDLLRAADLGVCFRKKAPSTAGIAPIKLGEYLMCGLPVVYSEGIGDLDELLADLPFAHTVTPELDIRSFVDWWESAGKIGRSEIAEFGRRHFSLESTLDSYQKALNS